MGATDRRTGVQRLLAAAREQGFETRKTRKGVVVLGKDGQSTTMLHFTNSDHRAIKNSRAALRRLGVDV